MTLQGGFMLMKKQKVVDRGREVGGFSRARLSVCGLRSSSRGFSLLELMVVMLIMFILMGISTVGLRGLVSGSGFSGAVSITRGAFSQARQHAMMQAQPTAVILEQDGNDPGTLRVLAGYGTVARVWPGNEVEFVSDLPWNSGLLVGATVYNFAGSSTSVVADEDLADRHDRFRVENGGIFSGGDAIAFQLGNMRQLPNGFTFHFGGGNRLIVEFDADGTVSTPESFEIRELGRAARSTINVLSTGRIGVSN